MKPSLVFPAILLTATGRRALLLGWSGNFYYTSEFAEIIEVR